MDQKHLVPTWHEVLVYILSLKNVIYQSFPILRTH